VCRNRVNINLSGPSLCATLTFPTARRFQNETLKVPIEAAIKLVRKRLDLSQRDGLLHRRLTALAPAETAGMGDERGIGCLGTQHAAVRRKRLSYSLTELL
jgi:hypothetical protein